MWLPDALASEDLADKSPDTPNRPTRKISVQGSLKY